MSSRHRKSKARPSESQRRKGVGATKAPARGTGGKRTGARRDAPAPPAQPKGPPVELEIVALGGRGDAIARRDNGEVVLLDGGAPGDVVRVQLQGRRSGVARGHIVALVQAGPHRVIPPCPVADTCGGCTWQHIDPARQRVEKARNAARAVGVEPQQMGAPQVFGWRRRARFHLRTVDGVVRAGFMAEGSDALVSTPSCPVLQPPLDTLPGRVARWVSPWLERGEGLAHLGAEGVVLRVQGKAASQVPEIGAADAALLGVVGIEIATDTDARQWGVAEVTLAETVDNDPVQVDAGGFSQAGAAANTAIRDAVRAALATLQPLDGARELFAGSGNLTGLLLAAAPTVVTIERNAAATERARRVYADAGGRLQIRTGDASDPGGAPVGREVWLLDPGRPGAKTTCERIAVLRPAAVIYVSCAPDTLRRDLAPLRKAGYSVTESWWVDTFPHTPHLELIVLLTLG